MSYKPTQHIQMVSNVLTRGPSVTMQATKFSSCDICVPTFRCDDRLGIIHTAHFVPKLPRKFDL